MSLILKGIDLPKDGETIVLKIKGSKIYQEYPSRYKFQPTRIKDAKAIQIPKDHGRLIDADKLRRGFSRTESGYCGYWEFCDKPEDMQFLIDDEPTILEAET